MSKSGVCAWDPLFYLFINDSGQELAKPCFIFAHDGNLAGRDIYHDIEAIKRWFACWDLDR